jgi:hypothetical protein
MLRACLFPVFVLPFVVGCGGGASKTVPVSGRVTLDNEPLPNATVVFVPISNAPDKEPLPSSVGVTGSDGRYTLLVSTSQKGKGAVVGKHKVLITLGSEGGAKDSEPSFHKQLPQKYNRKTELECEVPAQGRNDANFDLKSQ